MTRSSAKTDMHSVVIVVMSFKNTNFGTNQKPVCTSYYRTIL